jgi:hypothetical protein
VQATAVYLYFVNDKLKVPSSSALANFPDIEQYPNNESSQMVATYIRALVNGLPLSLELPADWRRYFWDRGSTLEPCEAERHGNGG